MNLLHVAIVGAWAYRYLAIADEVPDAPPRPTRDRAGSDRSRSRR
jgi:hypothetical protein